MIYQESKAKAKKKRKFKVKIRCSPSQDPTITAFRQKTIIIEEAGTIEEAYTLAEKKATTMFNDISPQRYFSEMIYLRW